MNYDEMPAGPEMDRLVVEKVMGWEEIMIPCDDQMPVDDGNPLVRYYEKPGGSEPICWTEFTPSTNIAHAWEVVGKMREDPDRMFVVIELSDESYAGQLHYREQIIPSELTKARTTPLAICRAALKIVNA